MVLKWRRSKLMAVAASGISKGRRRSSRRAHKRAALSKAAWVSARAICTRHEWTVTRPAPDTRGNGRPERSSSHHCRCRYECAHWLHTCPLRRMIVFRRRITRARPSERSGHGTRVVSRATSDLRPSTVSRRAPESGVQGPSGAAANPTEWWKHIKAEENSS
ncbi:hypothetical protein MRX96_009946 [Rhipicephalus microplus]